MSVPISRMGIGTHVAFWYIREVVPVPEDIFGTEEKWYRYPIDSDELVPVPVKVVSVPLLPAALFLHILHR